MTLTLDQARQAGAIVAEIDRVQALLDLANTAKANGWAISKLAVTDMNGAEHALLISNLNGQDAINALAYTIGVYQTMLTNLNAQLAAITA